MTDEALKALPLACTDYLVSGGLWNPELANQDVVSQLLRDCRDGLQQLAASLVAVEAERDQSKAKLIETLNDATRLLNQERHRWYASLSFLGDIEGLAPEVVGDRLRWQPIETAPKDRTRIDIWAKTWLPTFDRFGYRRFADCTWMDGDSMCNRPAYWLHLDKEWCPTHWRHIPAPPPSPQADQETR